MAVGATAIVEVGSTKRSSYGRAGFELLRARVLPYSLAVAAGPAP